MLCKSQLSALLFLTYSSVALSASYTCKEALVPVNISAQTTTLNITPPSNQTELSGLNAELASLTSNVTTSVSGGKTELNASYKIFTELCVPDDFKVGGTVQLAIHGVNFDHTYWSFGGKGSQYNYVEAAVNAGYAILSYDRLSIGKSSTPDGIKEVQAATEVEVAAALVQYLRDGVDGKSFGKVIGIGHSLGSFQLIGLAAKHGNILNGTILTGVSASGKGMPASTAAFDLRIASEQNAQRFAGLSSSYLATGGINGDQIDFFLFPFFEQSVLEEAEASKGTVTLGELLTTAELSSSPAPSYSNAVLIVTGAKDFIVCGGNCYQPMGNYTNLVAPVKDLFPAVSDFTTLIIADTGHGVNLHFSAPSTYKAIEEWTKKFA